MILFAIRRLRNSEGRNPNPGMFWVSIFNRQPFHFLGHGGWVYFNLCHPLWTLSWWRRHAITIPRQRGWRWD